MNSFSTLTANFAPNTAVSTPIGMQGRPLLGLTLPSTWGSAANVLVQGCIIPDPIEADWFEIADQTGASLSVYALPTKFILFDNPPKGFAKIRFISQVGGVNTNQTAAQFIMATRWDFN